MDAIREERKKELLKELTELLIDEQVEQGMFLETPHYSLIERQAVTLGRRLSREAQERTAREVAAHGPSQVACPKCQSVCDVKTRVREVRSLDGPVELTETVANCDRCRRSFLFAQRSWQTLPLLVSGLAPSTGKRIRFARASLANGEV